MPGMKRIVARVSEFRPNVVLSTHAHLNHGFFDLARRAVGEDKVRCVTYCGELAAGYGFSRHWVNADADLFVGAVEEVTEAAIGLGMDAQRARTGGFLLAPGFYDVVVENGLGESVTVASGLEVYAGTGGRVEAYRRILCMRPKAF